MTPKANHEQIRAENQESLRDLLQEKMKLAIQYTLIRALEEEVEAYIQAGPYERTQNRRDHRNGTYLRGLGTSMGELEDLRVPRTRKGFQSQLLDRYRRRQAELDESICQMFVQGVSTEKVGKIVETLSGSHPSPSTVSRVFHTLEEEFATWKRRPLLFQEPTCSSRLLQFRNLDIQVHAIYAFHFQRHVFTQDLSQRSLRYTHRGSSLLGCLFRPSHRSAVLHRCGYTASILFPRPGPSSYLISLV